MITGGISVKQPTHINYILAHIRNATSEGLLSYYNKNTIPPSLIAIADAFTCFANHYNFQPVPPNPEIVIETWIPGHISDTHQSIDLWIRTMWYLLHDGALTYLGAMGNTQEMTTLMPSLEFNFDTYKNIVTNLWQYRERWHVEMALYNHFETERLRQDWETTL